MMKILVKITLIEESTAGNPPKVFDNQHVDIKHRKSSTETGADGHISVGNHPSTIIWFGGSIKDISNITRVKIEDNKGAVLLDGELNCHYGVPKIVDGGVKFDVLSAE